MATQKSSNGNNNPTNTQQSNNTPAPKEEAKMDKVQQEEAKIARGNIKTRPFDPKSDKLEDFVSMSEAAKQLGVRFQQVYQRAERGKLGVIVTLFNKKLVSKTELAKWTVVRNEYFDRQGK